MNLKKAEIARMIDHTLLKATATREQIRKLCEEAKDYGFASVCVNPVQVPYAAELLRGTEVQVCTVIGFPLGAATSAAKAFETRDAVDNGATEIDMVIDIGAAKEGNFDKVRSDIAAVVEAAQGRLVKVIIETCYLTEEEKAAACRAAADAKADFVKTSTGFGTGGATVHDVALMKAAIPAGMKVKAAGGIHSYEEAVALVQAGADRLGASAGIAIVADAED
ncbi:MAG: deoxyribose-phosphate aldolase [Clostridia bacterium]|nr:deoxyribose-phosphate aldolase [Clostridia bacterium]